MYFDKFENCIQFDGSKKHFSEFNGYDYQYIPTWNITKDSILDMTGITYIIKKYTKEMIILSSQTGRIDTLEKISNIDIPKNYRKYQKSIFCTRRLLTEPTLKSKACLKCLYFTIIIFDLCRYLEYFSYLYTINQTE